MSKFRLPHSFENFKHLATLNLGFLIATEMLGNDQRLNLVGGAQALHFAKHRPTLLKYLLYLARFTYFKHWKSFDILTSRSVELRCVKITQETQIAGPHSHNFGYSRLGERPKNLFLQNKCLDNADGVILWNHS